jgi:hypothetical protein
MHIAEKKLRKGSTYIMYGYEIITQKLGSCFHAVYAMLRVALLTCAKKTCLVARFQVSAKWRRTVLFWALTQALKMGRIGCPETSVRNCHYTLRNSPEYCSFQHVRFLSVTNEKAFRKFSGTSVV